MWSAPLARWWAEFSATIAWWPEFPRGWSGASVPGPAGRGRLTTSGSARRRTACGCLGSRLTAFLWPGSPRRPGDTPARELRHELLAAQRVLDQIGGLGRRGKPDALGSVHG